MIPLFFIIASLLVLLYIGVELKGDKTHAFFFKALASFSFIVVFVIAAFERPYFDPVILLFLLGLVSGLLGDLFLALRPLLDQKLNEMLINRGILAFSIGHIFYFSALILLHQFHWIAIVVSIVITTVVIVMSYVMKFEMKKNRYPAYIYSFLIFLMVGQAIYLTFSLGFQGGFGLILIGAILFGISDLILAPIYFKSMKQNWLVALNLLTYYAAQLLIALSIFYL